MPSVPDTCQNFDGWWGLSPSSPQSYSNGWTPPLPYSEHKRFEEEVNVEPCKVGEALAVEVAAAAIAGGEPDGEPVKVEVPARIGDRSAGEVLHEPLKVKLPKELLWLNGAADNNNTMEKQDNDINEIPRKSISMPDVWTSQALKSPLQGFSSPLLGFALEPSSPPGLESPPGLAGPSQGSAMHGTGNCRPCAWFWKPGSCLNAENCDYCHLCPEGELKARKKSKVAAMRMGGLTPKPKNGSERGSPNVLRLSAFFDEDL